MRLLIKAAVAVAAIVLLLLALRHAGPALVVDQPRHSDLIVVLAGGDDRRYWRALELLRAGYARRVLVDARGDEILFGRTPAAMAADFVRRTAGNLAVDVCPTTGDSTLLEMRSAARCIQPLSPHTMMVVSSDYHTRRGLSIARSTYPAYVWTAAGSDEGLLSDPRWWSKREIVKNVFLEWQKLVWWQVVERHK